MKTVCSLLLIVATVLALAAIRPVNADSPLPQVRAVMVTEDGDPIGNLKSPPAGMELPVSVTVGDHQIQIFLLIHILPGAKSLIITQMEDPVVTALSDQGVVGRGLKRGWELSVQKEQDVQVTVTGASPVGVKEYDLLEVILVTTDEVANAVRVRGTVERPRGPIPWPLIGGVVGGVAVGAALAGLWVWRRRAVFNPEDWR